MEPLPIRELTTETLMDINASAGTLLAHPQILAAEMKINLEALRADITAVLEERRAWTSLDLQLATDRSARAGRHLIFGDYHVAVKTKE